MKFGKIEQVQFFPNAKPEEIYDAVADPKIQSKYTGSKTTFDPVVGGKFTAWDDYIDGKNLELVRGKKIFQEWRTTEFPKSYPYSMLEFTFRAKDDGTELKMVHSKVPFSQVKKYDEGWVSAYWDPLRKYLENRNNVKKRK